jgi:cbb3-type cytochrome oxidase cytochrome c subunit
MNYGPLIFLAAFVMMAVSWFGFVLKPRVQLGAMRQTNALGSSVSYPLGRSGMARQGLQVYRANGCAYCHSQQLQQSGTLFEAVLNSPGTNMQAVQAALMDLKPGMTAGQALELLNTLPKTVLRGAHKSGVDSVVKALNTNGAAAALWVVPVGTDMERGWGKRRSVAEDFLFDDPVMPGSQRVGPDLANVGSRLPDPTWHLRHLYAPQSEVKGSTMPPYRYLFEQRKIARGRSGEAVALSGPLAAPAGYEIVPTAEAKTLVAYLLSLKADTPLFSAPLTAPSATPPVPAPGTNGPPSGTNAPATAYSPDAAIHEFAETAFPSGEE